MQNLTVVLTNYNRPKIILPVIDSIINQYLESIDFDILIVDDGSSYSIDPNDLIKYGNKVTFHKLFENRGLHGARNAGLKLAKGEFVLVADDDDLFIPNTLKNALSLITSLDGYTKYPVFQFARTNGRIPGFYALINEGYYFNNILKGDFTPIFNKEVFINNGFIYPEYDEIRNISGESLLWLEIAYKIGIPTWNYNIVRVEESNRNERLTNFNNFRKKGLQFARYQELIIEYMEQRGFDKKYPKYFSFKIKGLYTYLLLSNKREEARYILQHKYNVNFFVRIILFSVSFLPVFIVEILLKIYRSLS